MRRFGMAAAAALMALGLGMAEARTVRWSASGDPNTMDPHSQNVGTVTMVLQQIYAPLIHRSADLSLRQGVRFHEGDAFTADDVVFSITRALQPTSYFGIHVDSVDRAVQVDDFTVAG